MINDKIGEKWKKLYQFKIVKLNSMTYKKGLLHINFVSNKDITGDFETVIIGYNQVMLLYEEMLKNEPFDDLKIELLGQSGLVLLITTIESYLEQLFYSLCRSHTVKDVVESVFKKYLKDFDIKIKYEFEEIETIRLSNYFPEKINFQNKNLCKNAFSLFGFKIAEIETKLWETIYAGEKCYIQIRHGFIHADPAYGLYKINRINTEYFEEIMFNIARFLCLVDDKILELFNMSW